MTYQFKITGKQEFPSGQNEVTTNLTLTAVHGQGDGGTLQIATKVQAEADAMNFGDFMTVTIAKEV